MIVTAVSSAAVNIHQSLQYQHTLLLYPALSHRHQLMSLLVHLVVNQHYKLPYSRRCLVHMSLVWVHHLWWLVSWLLQLTSTPRHHLLLLQLITSLWTRPRQTTAGKNLRKLCLMSSFRLIVVSSQRMLCLHLMCHRHYHQALQYQVPHLVALCIKLVVMCYHILSYLSTTLIFTQHRSVPKSIWCFQWRPFVCLCVDLCVCLSTR